MISLMCCVTGKNKKRANDAWILQAAINQCATAPACITDEFTKPQLSTHIVNKFHSYAWAAMGNEIMDGIMPFNIAFMIEPVAQAMATKLEHLKAIESGGTAMGNTDAKIFLKSDLHFPADTTACAYHLATHSLLMDIMLGEHNTFAVSYVPSLHSALTVAFAAESPLALWRGGLHDWPVHLVLAHSAISVFPLSAEAWCHSHIASL